MHSVMKPWIARVTLAALCLVITLPARADFYQGLRAYNRSDFARARTEFFQSAMEGHADAQFYLGEIYEGGVGVEIDHALAFDWYLQAAQQEHARAQRRLARLFSRGLGTGRDETKAFTWYLRAAGNGDVLAQLQVGLLYSTGQGTRKNPVKAYKWLTIAASYGDPDALALRSNLDGVLSEAEQQRALALARDWEQAWERRSGIRL